MQILKYSKGVWRIMKKKKKQWCSCTPQYENCNVDSETINNCKPTTKSKYCKKPVKKYVECPIEDYEITCVDKCADLAEKAEKLFEKALDCECKAVDAFEKAEELEKKAKVLSAKANKLLKNANSSEGAGKEAECKAKQLMEKAEELCEQAKCLYKEAKCVEKEADQSCEEARCLYEKAQEYNEKAKDLYNQAMKYDEKALKCYKSAGDKAKEYELKSKKCQEMIAKCSNKLSQCDIKPQYEEKDICKYQEPCQEYNPCKTVKGYQQYINCEDQCNNVAGQYGDDEIIYIEDIESLSGNLCSTYVSPMYDMSPMQFTGELYNEYPSLDMPYIEPYINQYQDINDMWMSYYSYLQNMMMKNMFPMNKNY